MLRMEIRYVYYGMPLSMTMSIEGETLSNELN